MAPFRPSKGSLMHRVLQRVDLSLEARLSDAVSAAVQQQLDAMVPHLAHEIETVLRTLVTRRWPGNFRSTVRAGDDASGLG